ncbi:MAG: hypothetical protein R3A44_17935 [Caldilineaceae bacterium]
MAQPELWSTASGAFWHSVQNEAQKQNAVQIVVICAAQNLAKQ